jgi:hypothetical protein
MIFNCQTEVPGNGTSPRSYSATKDLRRSGELGSSSQHPRKLDGPKERRCSLAGEGICILPTQVWRLVHLSIDDRTPSR